MLFSSIGVWMCVGMGEGDCGLWNALIRDKGEKVVNISMNRKVLFNVFFFIYKL